MDGQMRFLMFEGGTFDFTTIFHLKIIYLALFGVIIFSTTLHVWLYSYFFILTHYINTMDLKSQINIKKLDFLLWKPQICLMNHLH